MKAKEITIKVESLEETGKRFTEAYNEVKAGKAREKQEFISFENLETLRKVLTTERIRLLKLIRAEKPKTIYALSRLAKRPYANVFSDVKTLKGLGLIELGKESRGIEPIAKYSGLKIAIPV